MRSSVLSIRRIFALAILAVAAAITVFMTAAVTLSFLARTRANLEAATAQTVSQARRNLNSYVTGIIKIGAAVPDIVNGSDSPGQIVERLNVIKNSRDDIVTIDVFSLSGELLFGTTANNVRGPEEIEDQDWFRYSQTHNNGYYFSVPHVQRLVHLKYPWVISYAEVISLGGPRGSRTPAILLIDINQSSIDSLVKAVSIGKSGYCYFVDRNYGIVYHPKQIVINLGQFTEDIDSLKSHILGKYYSRYLGSRRYTVIDTIDFTGWKIVGVSFPDEEIPALMLPFLGLISLLFLAIIAISVVLSRIVANYVTSPIMQLEREMERFSISTFKAIKLNRSSLEVQSLANSFAGMAARMKNLMADIVEEQKLIRKSELEALQAKINPHFLYNTLDSIVWLAEQRDYQNVIEMVKALSNLFRISISRDREIITVEEELKHVECYLTIQKKRFADKFVFTIALPDELRHKPILKMLVQPIVENAIYHGIQYMMDPGEIGISARRDDGDIVITVSDNGSGMDGATRETILTTDRRAHGKSKGGIGVFNVNKRVKLAYGDRYGLSVRSEIEEGSTFEIRIPYGADIEPVNKVDDL